MTEAYNDAGRSVYTEACGECGHDATLFEYT